MLMLLFISLWHPLQAQGTPSAGAGGEIHGRVVSSAGQVPIEFANVEVRKPLAAAAIARTATGADGAFSLRGIAPGNYRVRIVAIGYTAKELGSVTIGPGPDIDLGTIVLTSMPFELPSIVIQGQRPVVELAPDRNTFVVRDLPTTKGGTALDVLRNVPAVDVDIDNLVSLRGNSGVVIQINGRPSPMKGTQLGNFLAQLPADVVDKVEVVTNPSAREDPTGVAGIINIVLKQKPDAGSSGGLTVGGGTTGHADIGGNLGYQNGPFSIYGSYGFFRDNRPRRDSIFRENTFENPVTFLDESGLRSQEPLAHTVTGTAGYALDKQDELSAELIYSTRVEHESNDILYRDLNAAQSVTGLSDRLTHGNNFESSLEGTLGYTHTFGEDHELSSELGIVRDEEGGPSSIVSHALALDGSPSSTTAQENQAGWEHPRENSLKVDYGRPLSQSLRIDVGYKGLDQGFHTTLATRVFDSTQAAFVNDSSRISNFTYDQVVHAVYGVLGAAVDKFQLQGGVRIERATTTFHLRSLGTSFNNDYNSVFPSALVAYNINELSQVKLSYSTRIRRPDDTDLLDPTPHIQDPLNISIGNPSLKPEYIRAFELGLQRTMNHLTVQVTPFFRHTVDAIRSIRTIDSAGVSTRSFANLATSDAYGTDLTFAMSGGRLSGFAGASAFRQVSNASNLPGDFSVKTFGWNARTNASFRFSSTLDLQILLSYQAPMNVEQGRNSSRTRFSFAVRQKLRSNQVSLTLRVIDPFNTARESSTTIDPLFTQVTNRRRTIRGLLLSANWTFGHPPKEHQRDPNDSSRGDTVGQ
ncbi:MAG: TonB-dependent receptor [Gemmatimonadota bacterium]